jgi:hypothetical protein
MLCLWGWEIVYINVTCIYERCAFEDVRLFMWMLHAFTRWAFEMWDCLCECYMHSLDEPLRIWDCLCKCYMLEPLRMWDCLCKCYMLCLWGWEIVYINVTCIYERCAFEMWDCLCKCYMHLLDVPLRMWDCLCECYMHLLDVPLRMWDCLCECYMHLLDEPLRCEIVYVNVTCIR